jgi:hypothetical protein
LPGQVSGGPRIEPTRRLALGFGPNTSPYRYGRCYGASVALHKSWMGFKGGIQSMTANWVSTQISCGPNSGRILDTARGILIGLRRCPSESAFDELFNAAQRHNVPVFAMAWALVRLAGDSGPETPSFMDAQRAARQEWGELFAASAVAAC